MVTKVVLQTIIQNELTFDDNGNYLSSRLLMNSTKPIGDHYRPKPKKEQTQIEETEARGSITL
jgi:hypothetical protein